MVSTSFRNLILLFLTTLFFDVYVQPHVDVDYYYRKLIYPFAVHRMFEPVVAVLSFGVACSVFTVAKFVSYYYYLLNKNKNQINNNNNKNQQQERSRSLSADENFELEKAQQQRKINKNKKNNNKKKKKKSDDDEDEEEATTTTTPPPTFVNGNFYDWFFWGSVNVGLYLGLIEIFQRIIQLEKFYVVDDHYGDYGTFTATRVLAEVLLSNLGYDLLFAIVHKSFHSKSMPRWWQAMHLIHHDHYEYSKTENNAGNGNKKNNNKRVSVMTTFHHHFIDATIQIALNAFFQKLVGFGWLVPRLYSSSSKLAAGGLSYVPQYRHTLSKFWHNAVTTWLLTSSHSGCNYSWQFENWLFPEWFSYNGVPAAIAHEGHHHSGGKPYHQFYTILDEE